MDPWAQDLPLMAALFFYTWIMCLLQYSTIIYRVSIIVGHWLFTAIIMSSDGSRTISALVVNMLRGQQPPFPFSFGQDSEGSASGGSPACSLESRAQYMSLRTIAKEQQALRGWWVPGLGAQWASVWWPQVQWLSSLQEVTAKRKRPMWRWPDIGKLLVTCRS